jgi:hypothetical protein
MIRTVWHLNLISLDVYSWRRGAVRLTVAISNIGKANGRSKKAISHIRKG